MPPPSIAAVQDEDLTSEQLFLGFAQRRDSAVLERLLQPHLPQAYALAHRILANDADADDAVQEDLVRLVKTCDRYDGSVAFAAWLGQLVRHAAVDVRRARGARTRRESAIDPEAIGDDPASSGDIDARSVAIRRAVAELPERYRAPIELHYYGQLSQEQTAQALGLKENAVAQRISRARERLRASLMRGGVALGVTALADALAAAETAPVVPTGRSAAELASLAMTRAAAPGVGTAWTTAHAVMAIAAGLVVVGAITVATIAGEGADTAAGRVTTGQRWWTFATPDTPGLTRISGTWRHEATGGTGDGGSMVIESDDFMALIEAPEGSPPLRLSIRCRPMLPMPADGLGWIRLFPEGADLAAFGNVGRVNDTDQATIDSPTLFDRTVLVSGDSLDWWSAGARTSLVFYRRSRPTTRWILATHGPWRIDDLRFEPIEPGALPDVGIYRAALAAIPPADRHGDHAVAGLRGLDPDEPVTITFMTADEAGAPTTAP